MEQMDRRVQQTEAALEQGSVQASTSASSAASHSNNLVGGSTTEQATVENVVPSIDYLRTNDSLQSEVERRLVELRNINEFATRGRVKGGGGVLGRFRLNGCGLATEFYFNQQPEDQTHL